VVHFLAAEVVHFLAAFYSCASVSNGNNL